MDAPTQPKSNRFTALDGLRGVAVIAVILNHIPLGVLFAQFPAAAGPFLTLLLSSGKTGVNILFLLTGFLMGWLYPRPKSALSFWGKRYSRLFPTFLVMAISLTFIKATEKSLNPLFLFLIILVTAIIARLIWEAVRRLSLKTRFPVGKTITAVWLSFQILVACWYSFFLLHVPPSVFYQVWSHRAQWWVTGVVNATLTLPFGQYIAQVDGVYWSLVMEVFFYLLYPLLFVPIIAQLKTQPRWWVKAAIAISVLPFGLGLKMMLDRIAGFSLIQPQFITYFIAGVGLAASLPWLQKQAKKVPAWLSHPVWILPVMLLTFSHIWVYQWIPHFFHPWIHVLWLIPSTALIAMLVSGEKNWGRWLSHPWLTKIGKYSYSLYLVHAFSIDVVVRYLQPTSLINALLLIVVSLLLSGILAWILFQIVEKPYFNLSVAASAKKKSSPQVVKSAAVYLPSAKRVSIILGCITLVLFAGVFIAYRPPFALFTSVHRVGDVSVWNALNGENGIPLTDQPLRFNFTALQNNLGMVTTSLHSSVVNEGRDATAIPGDLTIRLRDAQNIVVAESISHAHEIGSPLFHPLGFPLLPNSNGQQYTIEYQITRNDPARMVELMTSEGNFVEVYFLQKNELLKNPRLLVQWMVEKLTEPFTTPVVWIAIVQLFPLIVGLWINTVLLRPRKALAVKKNR
jgi:peptidoglycan/LPS O-acetylase OafA/YrhL